MDALSLTLKADDITPKLEALEDPALKKRMLQAAGTLVESYAVRAFDEPSLRPQPWPARKKSKATNPLLIKSGDMQQGIHTQVQGSDAVKVGSPAVYASAHQLGSSKKGIPPRPFFPMLDDQLTGSVSQEIHDVLSGIIERAAE
ncbi:phage virion morphogenesis protein [Prosthecobacter sp.]|uniref:phage virion morphogenesis protein n=1 Tax=Prosthecobacter sp. TaxID=1965333 RepID=UPI0037848273